MADSPPVVEPAERERQALISELAASFAARLENPREYRKTVKRECRGFPEGDLFPYLFPLYAFTGMAEAGRMEIEEARQLSAQLLLLAIPVVSRRLKAPGGDLTSIADYGEQATYLCQLNTGLGHYRLLGGEDHLVLHDHLTGLIRDALHHGKGAPLRSFPGYSWPFDTIPCLASIALHDRATGNTGAEQLAASHFNWIDGHATDQKTTLPYSRVEDGTGCGNVAPRGCDLSLRLLFLSWFAPLRMAETFKRYANHFWRERLVLAGFAEWPTGTEPHADIDSGPIFLGIGSAASALGIAAVRAAGDEMRLSRLLSQVHTTRAAVDEIARGGTTKMPARIAGMIPVHPKYVTGFLFGDAVLFMSLAAPVK